MINLSGLTPFAQGGNRKCFVHPHNNNRCLKVLIEGNLKKVRENAPWFKKFRSNKIFDDNMREQIAYNQRALKNNNQDKWKHLAKWYGMVETSIGLASETELIRDNKKNIAITLEKYLFTFGITDEIENAINEFESWLRSSLVLTKNIIPHNIVLGYDNEKIILKIIDGLGSKSYLPLTHISDMFARLYVERRIKLMRSRIKWDLSGRKGSWK
tara:strand:+ start:567 stop:1205 length:639 start_codon:yes stop_codon:yes gene_type:complete